MKIDKNIPMLSSSLYPWNEMEVGDSFYIETTKRLKLLNSAAWFGYKNPPFKVATRKEAEGFRVWRIK